MRTPPPTDHRRDHMHGIRRLPVASRAFRSISNHPVVALFELLLCWCFASTATDAVHIHKLHSLDPFMDHFSYHTTVIVMITTIT